MMLVRTMPTTHMKLIAADQCNPSSHSLTPPVYRQSWGEDAAGCGDGVGLGFFAGLPRKKTPDS